MGIHLKKAIEDCASIFELSSFNNWFGMLSRLESIIINENWKYNNATAETKNTIHPVLENYVCHTFRRLIQEYREASSSEEKQLIFYHDENLACFNTGLFTPNYNMIYALFYPNTNAKSTQPYFCYGFVEESDNRLSTVGILPRRASYFSDVRELIYDSKLDLRINAEHVLRENIDRFPAERQSDPMLCTLLLGAIEMTKKRVQANYKLAVPTYYGGEICLLLPICLISETKTDLALAIKRKESFYIAKTCLTLDMAYNDARLIAKPSSDWLLP